MTEFEKGVYSDLGSTDRVLLWMVKALELKRFMDMMKDEDFSLLKRLFVERL